MRRVYEDAMHRVEVPEKGDRFDPAQIFEAFERFAADWPSPKNVLPKLKERITDIFVTRGYPAPDAGLYYRGRDFRAVLAVDLPELGERITLGWKYARKFSEPLTVEREAADIYCNIFEVELALEGGDLALVFAHGLRLGARVEQFKLRRLHLKAVTTGAKVLKAVESGAEKTNAMHGSMRKVRLLRMGEHVLKMSVDKAAVECMNEGLGNWESIKRQWNRHKKKGDT